MKHVQSTNHNWNAALYDTNHSFVSKFGNDGLRNWIMMFGNSIFEDINEDMREQILTKIEHRLQGSLYTNGRWIANYKRIRVIGVKE